MKLYVSVRLAEWSKAPDSREILLLHEKFGNSGPRMRAWVQIPHLTIFLLKDHCKSWILFVGCIRTSS